MTRRHIALTALVAVLLAGVAACAGTTPSSRSDAAASSATQKDDGAGSVTLEATWVTPDHLAGDDELRAVAGKHAGEDIVLLHVRMNTHSVNLSKYDLAKLATLDGGAGPEAAIEAVKISDDQHHAEAALVFKRPARTSTATLTVRDIAGVAERTLRWSPPPT